MIRLRKVVATTLLVVMTGCTAIKPVLEPSPFIQGKRPNLVYVVDRDGRVFTIARPKVQGDSVVGVSPSMDKTVGLPLSAVGQVQASQVDHRRTAAFIGLLGVGAAGLVYFAARAGGGVACDPTTSDPKGYTPNATC